VRAREPAVASAGEDNGAEGAGEEGRPASHHVEERREGCPGGEREQHASASYAPAGVPPHILAALQASGGRADMEDVMVEIARSMEGVLRPADHETVNQGEVRWRYAARLERKAMLDDGLVAPPREPGVWELTDLGRSATE